MARGVSAQLRGASMRSGTASAVGSMVATRLRLICRRGACEISSREQACSSRPISAADSRPSTVTTVSPSLRVVRIRAMPNSKALAAPVTEWFVVL